MGDPSEKTPDHPPAKHVLSHMCPSESQTLSSEIMKKLSELDTSSYNNQRTMGAAKTFVIMNIVQKF